MDFQYIHWPPSWIMPNVATCWANTSRILKINVLSYSFPLVFAISLIQPDFDDMLKYYLKPCVFWITTSRHIEYFNFGSMKTNYDGRNGFYGSEIVYFDILHDFVLQLDVKIWRISFSRWPPAAILDFSIVTSLALEHLGDFESLGPW